MINPADLLMIIHFLWAAFMILGLPIGLITHSSALRWTHFIGMLITAAIAMTGAYCPLTIWEEILRWEGNSGLTHSDSFLAHHMSKVLYPNLEPWIIRAASVIWGVITLLAMLLVPPRAGVRPGKGAFQG